MREWAQDLVHVYHEHLEKKKIKKEVIDLLALLN